MQQNFCFAAVSNDEAKSLGCVKLLDLASYGAVIFHPDNLPQLTLGKDRNTFCLSAPALRCGKVIFLRVMKNVLAFQLFERKKPTLMG